MNEEQRFNRNARTWLETGPTEAPEQAVKAALLLIDTTPQERDLRVPLRIADMNRFALLGAAAVLVAALGLGGLLVFGRPSTTGPAAVPTPSATASLAPSPTTQPSPTATPTAFTGSFTSPTYGYSIGLGSDWTVDPATTSWSGVDNRDTDMDYLQVTGTDTSIGIASQPMPADQSFEQWLIPFHEAAIPNVPPGCDGGDPSTWKSVTVGDIQGRWQQLCNYVQVVLGTNGRLYLFTWGNDTFNAGQHFQPSSFKKLLETVSFQAP